jgi:predicted ester cyclase
MDDLIAEGDQVVVHLTATVTQQGGFHGLPPTGQRVTLTSFEAWRVQDVRDVQDAEF